jgi:hypothetical protein
MHLQLDHKIMKRKAKLVISIIIIVGSGILNSYNIRGDLIFTYLDVKT